MNKKFFFAALASVMLAGCTNNEFVGDTSPTDSRGATEAINFGSGFKAITRADHVGADAATLLNNQFIVGGFKGDATAATGIVFDNYVVKWTANTAGTTESNTSDWEYVGYPAPSTSGIAGKNQTIKYWDYSQVLYDFVAYSLGSSTGVTPSAFNTSDHSFTLQGNEAGLTGCYIADRVTVEKANFGEEVTLSFRNLAAKVRVALYETVPGYSVKNVYFYQDNTTGIDTDISSNTSATLIGTFNTGGTYTITYPETDKTKADYNKAHVAIGGSTTTAAVRNNFGTLNYVAKEYNEKTGTNFLARTSTAPSFAGSSTYYQTVLPNETGTVMELRINYTLEATDGSGEEITIHGAKAYVPANYAQWLPNYAYTYIFKISDNTNGWTSTTDTDPAGLYPITFDAVVVDSEDNTQTTITTVASPSITTYMNGHDYTAKESYPAGDIYVQVMVDDALKNDLGSKGKLYTLSGSTPFTEAAVMDALNIGTTSGSVITGRNGIILTDATSAASVDATVTKIPRADGNNITVDAGTAAKFTAAANTYAYVYDATPTTAPASTYLYSAEVLTSQPSDWETAGVWFKDPNGATAVDTYADGTYYKKWENKNKVYGVKVIKVQ